MSTPSILPSSDAVSSIETDISNFDNFFELTFDVSDIDNLNINNVHYGFTQNNNVLDNIDFSRSNVLAGKSGGTTNFYLNQSLRLDIHRHVLWEHNNNVIVDTVPRSVPFFSHIDSQDESIEGQIQTVFDNLILEGPKLLSEISGNSYEYYFNIEKRLFEITLQDQARLDVLQTDISMARQSNPNGQQLTVNLKFSPGDALMVYVNYAFEWESQDIQDKKYKILLLMTGPT